ncbi:MAG: sigma-54-dependent transcriptional regulator [Terriglobales bacterium]
MAHILIVDDQPSICEMLDIVLRKENHQVEVVQSAAAARHKLASAIFDVVISDIRLGSGEDGLELLRACRVLDKDLAFVLMTGHGSMESAIEAIKIGGAVDYIIKTPELVDQVRYTVARALEAQQVRRENVMLKRELRRRNDIENLIGSSPVIGHIKDLIRTVAATSSTVLIRGESGTGKELVARAIHNCSPRVEQAFVTVNCGAFPEGLLESELFGYVKGAFTGANTNRRGLFEAADKGTLFLDEIGEMSLPMQVSLLRALQERQVRPLGSTVNIAVDVRLLAATNSDLERAIQEGRFREDLYYRISVIPMEVPALRQRPEDISLLAMHFLRRFAREMNKPVTQISPASVARMEGYSWPGNVRQLENTLERAVALSTGAEVEVPLPSESLVGDALAARDSSGAVALPMEGLEARIAQVERDYLRAALQQAHGVQTRAAELLQISYRSFRHYAKKYGVEA